MVDPPEELCRFVSDTGWVCHPVGVIKRMLATGTLAVLVMGLSGCSSDFDDAMVKGCDGLRVASQAYAAGDRQGVEDAKNDAEYLGMASELSGDKGVDGEQQADASEAHLAFNALFSAAYADKDNGELVWQGKTLDPQRERTLQAGLDACNDH